MADYRAIAATCEAIMSSLERQYDPVLFNNDLEFKVYTSQDFAQPMQAGISLFLYRVKPNGTHRTPAPSNGNGGSKLPLDLHFLLTAWGKDASLRHSLIGWMMRVIEDAPILGSGELNTVWSDVFAPGESVNLVMAELNNEDLAQIWDTFIRQNYQLSIPYLARVVDIDSLKAVSQPRVVRQKDLRVNIK